MSYVCHPLLCAAGAWTGWYDRDDPSGSGDWENIISEVVHPCGGATPVAARCEANIGGTWTPSDKAGQVLSMPCGITGLVCLQDANNQACYDYRVKYLCPPAGASYIFSSGHGSPPLHVLSSLTHTPQLHACPIQHHLHICALDFPTTLLHVDYMKFFYFRFCYWGMFQ